MTTMTTPYFDHLLCNLRQVTYLLWALVFLISEVQHLGHWNPSSNQVEGCFYTHDVLLLHPPWGDGWVRLAM